MVARVVRVQGKLIIELDAAAEEALGALEGREVELHVEGEQVVVRPGGEFDRTAREILARHAKTFEKLSK